MIHYSTIGKNYSTTLNYINNPVSEFFIPDPVEAMPCTTLQANYQKLIDQIADWGNKMNGANKKSIKNLTAIIEIQTDKLDRYQQMIDTKCTIQTDTEPETNKDPETEMTSIKPNYLLWGAIGLAVLFILKRK